MFVSDYTGERFDCLVCDYCDALFIFDISKSRRDETYSYWKVAYNDVDWIHHCSQHHSKDIPVVTSWLDSVW